MIRVLHVIGAMDRGGAETMIMNLYRKIDRSRIQFDFLVHETRICDYDAEIEHLGGYIYRDLPRYTGSNGHTYRKLCRNFFQNHPEHTIVHGHIGSSAPIYLDEAKKASRITIAHSHAQNFPLSISELAFRTLSHKTRNVADEFLSCSDQAGIDRFGKKIFNSDRCHVLKNAIDVSAYECTDAEHVSAKTALGYTDEFLIGHVGRFDPVKNHVFLIDVFEEILNRNSQARLVLVGRGPIEDEIKDYAAQKGLADKVNFYGVTDNVALLMKAFDVFVFPSLKEGLPLACIEAQAAGNPCVISTGVPALAQVEPRLLKRISLDEGVSSWADAVQDASACELSREQGAASVRSAGFDVVQSALWITSYYEGLCEKYADRIGNIYAI